MKRAIRCLDKCLETIKSGLAYGGRIDADRLRQLVTDALQDLKNTPRYETPEQYKERTGKEWPDDWAVYELMGTREPTWATLFYKVSKERAVPDRCLVCATEAGRPPDDWKPQDWGKEDVGTDGA